MSGEYFDPPSHLHDMVTIGEPVEPEAFECLCGGWRWVIDYAQVARNKGDFEAMMNGWTEITASFLEHCT